MKLVRITLAAGLMGLMAGAAMAAADQPLDEARQQILKSWRKYNTVRAKISGEGNTSIPGAMQLSAITGEYAMIRRGDKVLVRVEFINDEHYKSATDATTDNRVVNIQVDDGDVLYTLVKQRGRDTVYKLNRNDTKANVDLERMFVNIAREGDLKLLAESKVGDRPVYVIEQTIRAVTARTPFARNVFHFDKERGLLLKTESFDEIGNPKRTLEYSDFQIDGEIKPELFKFTPPPMAQIHDMTGKGQ